MKKNMYDYYVNPPTAAVKEAAAAEEKGNIKKWMMYRRKISFERLSSFAWGSHKLLDTNTWEREGKAIKIKVGANKLCGKVSDNEKKVESFVLRIWQLFYVSVSTLNSTKIEEAIEDWLNALPMFIFCLFLFQCLSWAFKSKKKKKKISET